VNGLLAASLGILKKRYQEKRDDGRGRVDKQLPSIEIREKEGRSPYNDQRCTEGEERCFANQLSATLSESVEVAPPRFLPYLCAPP
jgi:hypothetical protein